jgi:C1A family cysteine protease
MGSTYDRGWRPQPHDPNDKIYTPPSTGMQIPPKVDLRQLPSVKGSLTAHLYDQGDISSCTANAIATALRYGANAKAWDAANPGKTAPFDPSRNYIYFMERVMLATKGEAFAIDDLKKLLTDSSVTDLKTEKGTLVSRATLNEAIDSDIGAFIRTGIKCVQKYGVCSESTWNYTGSKTDASWARPPKGALDEGPKYLNVQLSYYRIRDLAETGNNLVTHMEAALAEGYPVIFGFWLSLGHDITTVYGGMRFGFDTPMYIFDGGLDAGMAGQGGHAVAAIGYDRAKKRFLIQNSMGERIPPGAGCFWMPYWWFEAPTGMSSNGAGIKMPACDDFWVIKADAGATKPARL